MDTRASTGARLSVLPVFIAFIMNIFLVAPVTPLTASPAGPSTAYADSHVTVTLEDGVAGCMGVRTTPGSENTTKELVGGTLEPGGTAVFRFTFPAEAGGNPGQEEWKLTDCVFLNDTPIQKYTVSALSNDVSPVIIEFALTIPSDAPIGSEYCNYAKTTETPSDAQASNRKAGPACFIVGGAIRVLKVDDATPPNPLPGATFTVGCQWPNVTDGTFLPDTILSVPTDGTINGGASTETIDSVDNGSFARTVVTGSEGVISVNGPDGTVCTFTETAAPGGFQPPVAPDNTVTLTIDAGGEQAIHSFVNTRAVPNVVVAKSASHSVVLAPLDNLVFTLTASNGGNALATGVTISDQIDPNLTIVSATWDNDPGTAGGTGTCSWTAGNLVTCEVGALAASDGDTTGAEPDAATATITVSVPVAACPAVANFGTVSATNEGAAQAGDNTSNTVNVTVNCPDDGPSLNIVKTADADPIDAGDEASFSIIIWNDGPGTALDVEFQDDLPAGLAWEFEILSSHDGNSCASSADESGTLAISCSFGDLAPSSMEEGIEIRVFGDTDRTDCGLLENLAWAEASNNDRVEAEADLTVSCPPAPSVPSLTIDKAADAEEIVISGPSGDLDAQPSIVTWTLSYTLTNGPVTNAVISDELPDGLVYVDGSATDGGVHDEATNTLTWTFATLSESGSVTFETAVDPETISRTAPTVNVAVIDSDQTPEDQGQDQVTVTVEQELGGNPTPTPKPSPTPKSALPDTAMAVSVNGEPITVPLEMLGVAFLASLSALALVNVRAARGPRR